MTAHPIWTGTVSWRAAVRRGVARGKAWVDVTKARMGLRLSFSGSVRAKIESALVGAGRAATC